MQGIDANKWVINKGWYEIIPEVLEENVFKEIKETVKSEKMHGGGWTKDRSGKFLGRIPLKVIYNYCWANGIPNDKINEFLGDDKGNNLVKILDEFPVFKVGEA